MKAILLLTVLVLSALAADKILGTRTETNYPTTWTKGNDASPSHSITFLIALKQRNLDVLEEAFWAISDPSHPEYRNFMTIEEIDAIVNPPKYVYDEVYAWLEEKGANNYRAIGDAIEVTANVSTIESLFNTRFVEFTHKATSKKIVRQFGQFSVPEKVADHIVLVSGLSEFPYPKQQVKRQSLNKRAAQQSPPAIVPQSIQSYYATGSAKVSNAASTVGVIEFEDQYFSPTDLSYFAQQTNVPITPVTAAHIVGSNDPTNPQLEATLDIEYALGVAQNAVGWFWIEADNVWLYGFATHLYGTSSVPLVNSISYGWNEEMQCEQGIGGAECSQLGVSNAQYVALVNTQFQKIGARGISLVSASGDSGANGRTDPYCSESNLNPVFPAASPYITSCGATQIDQTNNGQQVPNPPPICSGQFCAGSGGQEEAVSYAQSNFASGGGFSNVAPTPSYQQQAVQTYLSSGVALPPASYFNKTGRGFPDVAGFGSNVLIATGGSIEGVGGTSCASPIFAGIATLLNQYALQKDGKPLGFLNPLLYQMARNKPDTFKDITIGDNKCTEDGCSPSCQGFVCAKGWDPVTGLGTPNYANMLAYLQANL